MGFENFVKEAGKGKGLKVQPWMRGYMTYILPVIVMAFILLGLFYKG
jgi:transporter